MVAIRTRKAWTRQGRGAQLDGLGPVPARSKRASHEARAHLVDDVAGTDDTLTEKYLNDGDLTQEELDDGRAMP